MYATALLEGIIDKMYFVAKKRKSNLIIKIRLTKIRYAYLYVSTPAMKHYIWDFYKKGDHIVVIGEISYTDSLFVHAKHIYKVQNHVFERDEQVMKHYKTKYAKKNIDENEVLGD